MPEPAVARRPRGRPSREDGPVAPNDDLLPLALEAFADLGFEGASMRDLCRRLGVSHNLLHQRFGSKDRLWYAAVDHGFQALAADLVVSSEADEYEDDLERLRFLMIRWLEVMAGAPALARIINQESSTGGARLDYMFDRYIWPVTKTVSRFLAGLEREGRVRHLEPGTWHFLMVHGAGGPLSMRALAEKFGGAPTTDAEVRRSADKVVDVLLAGLRTDHERSSQERSSQERSASL
jgi:AcrR family transcriptional regulator